jgi:hypothetical protein
MTLRSTLITATALAALGCTAIAGAEQEPSSSNESPISCTIDITPRNGLLLIEGIATSQYDATGFYTLRVNRRGADITQGGPLMIQAGQEISIGQVQINGPLNDLNIELSVTADGHTQSCVIDT